MSRKGWYGDYNAKRQEAKEGQPKKPVRHPGWWPCGLPRPSTRKYNEPTPEEAEIFAFCCLGGWEEEEPKK